MAGGLGRSFEGESHQSHSPQALARVRDVFDSRNRSMVFVRESHSEAWGEEGILECHLPQLEQPQKLMRKGSQT